MVVLSNNSQSRWKDSIAAASSLDLCLLANGEEKTQIITAAGSIVFAGIDAPLVAPTVTDVGAGNLTASLYAAYAYVYAATTRYPAVTSNQGAGGNLSPRSNTSPATVKQFTGGGNRQVNVQVIKTDRQDIDKIWIYRTALFSDSTVAQTAAEAGQLFYIGSVNNDGFTGSSIYNDNSLTIQEQIESDNLVAPTAQFCVYYDPFFFLFGQNELEVEVDVSITGLVTILNSFDGVWFDGRDGQLAKFRDINSGGFDGQGTFYFQYVSPTTAQLTVDQDGTQLASAPYIGTTKVKIYGFSTTLYRSKPNNPFAWGETVAIGTAVVSRTWTMKVGGGIGIAMTIIPESSLLKLDLENPVRSYVLNLKQTQTDAFKSTRRLISDTYIPASNWSQFTGLDSNRQLQVFAIDPRNFCITQTDGSTVTPISDAVKNTTRRIIRQSTEHVHFHGFYDPNSELNCFFFREEDGLPTVHKMVYNHAPSKQWGTLDCFDILCSSVIQDNFTGKSIVLGGSVSGFIGQLFSEDKANNWIEQEPEFSLGKIVSIEDIQQIVEVTPPSVISEELDGRYFVLIGTLEGIAKYTVFWYSLNGAGARPSLFGITRPEDITIRYVEIDYFLGDTQADLAERITIQIDSLNYCPYGDTNFPFEYETYLGESFVAIKWKKPVLYSIPLTEYYDFNSGTTFNLLTEGGASLTYDATLWDNSDTVDLEKVIGNWAIIEKTEGANDIGILWGRVKNLDLTSTENRFRVYFDLLYSPYLEAFLYEIEGFMTNPIVEGLLLLTDGTSLLLLADGSGSLIINVAISFGNIYIGVNETKLRKYIDLTKASENKNLNEIWSAIKNTNQYEPYDPVTIGYLDQLATQPDLYIILNQDKTVSGLSGRDNWFINKAIERETFKTFGFALIQRGPSHLQISNFTLKM